MSHYLAFKEELISQIPALQLLQAMGYTYLTPAEALAKRGGKLSHVILEEVLEERLRVLNWIEYKGNRYPFSEANLKQALQTLKNEPYGEVLEPRRRREE
jgi:type I restriction enzyme R subunit